MNRQGKIDKSDARMFARLHETLTLTLTPGGREYLREVLNVTTVTLEESDTVSLMYAECAFQLIKLMAYVDTPRLLEAVKMLLEQRRE